MSIEEFVPLNGPAPDLLLSARKSVGAFLESPLSHTLKQYEQYGPLSGIVAMTNPGKPPPYVFTLGPDIFPELQNPAVFIPGTSRLYPPVMSDVLTTALAIDNLRFIERPALLDAAFTDEWLTRYVAQIEKTVFAELDTWERFRNGEPFDVFEPIRALARPLALKTVFGFEPDDEPARVAASLCQVHADAFALSAPSAIDKLAGTSKAAKHATRVLKMLTTNAHHAAGEPSLIGGLAAARMPDGGAFTDGDLFTILAGMYPAVERGFTSTLAWTLVLLSQNMRVLSSMQDELITVLHGKPITAADLTQLPYLENVVKETLRLFPPKVFGSRLSIDTVALGEWTLPQDVLFVHSPYATHRDKIVYDKPQHFLPHRFGMHKPSAAEFMPFADLEPVSRLVMALVKYVLGAIFQRHRLTMLRGQTINHRLSDVLEPIGPIPMYLVPEGLVYPVSVVEGSIKKMVEIGK